jgi:antitoxin component YwqK of YwqJK toxin-antitoxin module
MKTLMLAMLMAANVGAGTLQEDVVIRREWFPGGTLSLQAEYENGVRHGVYQTWYPDGRPYERKHYVNGREEGLQQAWTDDGELFLNYEMKDGRRYGKVNARPCLPAVDDRS